MLSVLLTQFWVSKYYFKTKKILVTQINTNLLFGYNEVLSDIIWIQSLQYGDLCSESEVYEFCKKPSVLRRFYLNIAEITPKYRLIYSAGGLFLTLLVKDYEGAEGLYDKAIEEFPNDWSLLYHAAINELLNLNNKPKAAELLKKAGENGAPQWVFALSARLYSETGSKEIGIKMLEKMIEEQPDGKFIERLKQRLEELKRQNK